MSTVYDVLTHLREYKLKHNGGKNYHSNRPWSPNSDSHGLSITITPTGLVWKDHVNDDGGDLKSLCAKLNLPQPNGAVHVPSTKRTYESLADYARRHGVSEEVFIKAGWSQTLHHNRPALAFQTVNGTRYRFTDGNLPTYISEYGYKACWYGLDKAVLWAGQQGRAIVLCNGEASTVVAQHYGIPACAVTGGERELPADCLAQLREAWGGPVWLAFDCDDTGRRAATDIMQQLPGSKILELGMTGGADLADFCHLYGKDALKVLADIAHETGTLDYKTTSVEETVDDHLERLDMGRVLIGMPIIIPFTQFHCLSGFARVVMPGKVVGIVAPSAHGKTSFLETWADRLMKRGYSGVWYGPEWTPEEYQDRRIQRYGGPTYEQMILWELWKHEHEMGIPEAQREGEELDLKLTSRAMDIDLDIQKWRGRLEYFESGARKTLETTLLEMADNLYHRRNRGEKVTFAVFDYAQLMRLLPENDTAGNRYESAIELIKQWTVEQHIVSFVGSQVTKAESKDHKAKGKLIDSHSAHYLRDDKFNLFITLNVQYVPDKAHPVWDEDAPMVMSDRAVANVSKNSAGRTGQVKLRTCFERLTWLDEMWFGDLPELPQRDLSDL